MYRHFLQAELVRCLEPHLPDDDNALFVHHDRLTPAELLNGPCRVDGRLRDAACVLWIRFDFRERPVLNLHYWPPDELYETGSIVTCS